MYGTAATMLITHIEYVHMPDGDVPIYFLYKEEKGSFYWIKSYRLFFSFNLLFFSGEMLTFYFILETL